MTELSDELLVAYVDGQLARKQTLAVDKVLEQDDVIARRVAALKDAHGRLEAAFDAILAGEEADAVAQPVPRSGGLFISWGALVQGGLVMAGICLALALLVAGFGWAPALPEVSGTSPAADMTHAGSIARSWQEEAARAQALVGRGTLEVGLDSQSNPDLIAFQLARVLGDDLVLPDLGPHGFALCGRSCCASTPSPWRNSYISARAASRWRFTPSAARGAPRCCSSAWRDRRCGLGAGRHGRSARGSQSEPVLLRLAEAIGVQQKVPGAEAKPDAASPPLPRPKPKPSYRPIRAEGGNCRPDSG